MRSARRPLVAALALAAAVGVWWWSAASSERRVEAVLAAVANLSGGRADVGAVVGERFAETAVVTIGAAPPLSGRAAIARAIAERLARGRVVVTLSALEVSVSRNRARATGRVGLSESQSGDLHADERRFVASLDHAGDAWRITGVEIAAETHEEPEARP